MRTLLSVFLLFFLLFPLWGKSDNNAVYFRCYYEKLNLPQTSILQIIQDGKGFLWLATGRGVYRFDGNEVVPLSQILPNYRKELSGYIPWIMIDDHENLWLSNGYIYELNTGNMYQNTIAGEPMLNAPLMDRQGNFWFNHHDRYVKYDRKNKRSVSVEAPVSLSLIHI